MVHDLSDRSEVVFDDERVVNAELVLPIALGRRLGIEALVDQTVDLGERPGAARPGRKVLSLIHAMLLGADCIDDCDVLRGAHRGGARAPGDGAVDARTFLRPFTFGHVRQLDRVLDRVLGQALGRAWRAGAGPGKERLVIDAAGHPFGHRRGPARPPQEGAGQHPARRAALRRRTARPRRRTGAAGQILMRADSGFHYKKVTARLREQGCEYSIGVTMQRHITERIARIPDEHWQPVPDYPDTGVCELAETTLGETA